MSKVVVAGSIITDMSVKVVSQPLVGETGIGKELTYSPGGKGANQVVSASRLGANTFMIGKVGDDEFANTCAVFLHKQGIYNSIKYSDKPTGIAMIIVNNKGDNSIVVNLGANEQMTVDDLQDEDITYEKGDILVSQFEIPLNVIKIFFERGKANGTINVLNPAPAQFNDNVKQILKLTDILVVNETELEVIAPKKSVKGFEWVTTTQDARESKEDIFRAFLLQTRRLLKIPVLIVTLGEKGAYGVIGEEILYIQSLKVNAIDTTGAGDCFVGALSAFISKSSTIDKNTIEKAMIFANKAASLSVQKQGSGISMPYLKDIK